MKSFLLGEWSSEWSEIKCRSIRSDHLKHVLKILYIVICTTMLLSCSRSYEPNEAIDRSNIVDVHGKITNADRLDSFISNMKDMKKDKIRITRYTVEGDPIFLDFTFDGLKLTYKYDNSNDKFGSSDVKSTVCKRFTKTNDGTMIVYKLEECSGKNATMGNQFSFSLGVKE